MKTISITMSDEAYRRTLWLLRSRYGKRKGDRWLFRQAVVDTAANEAEKLLETQGYQIDAKAEAE